MNATKLIFFFVIAALLTEIEAWRRRRRRRRRYVCSPVACTYTWSAWTACNCLGKSTRRALISKQPSCNGAACPANQVRVCDGQCVKGNGVCIAGTGLCQCYPGWKGRKCEVTCPVGTYGLNCGLQCKCLNGNGCDPITGRCKCTPVACSYKWNTWSECNCLGERSRDISIIREPSCGGTPCPSISTEDGTCEARKCVTSGGFCNEEFGFCQCYSGRMGATCELTCPTGYYGVNCAQKCDCTGGCDSRTGICQRSPVGCNYIWSTWSACNCHGKRTRRISIIQQPSCDGTPCPPTTTEYETCLNGTCIKEGGECNERYGFCQCNPGRNGTRCESTCPFGTYGLNCAHQCDCMNGCDPRTGDCKCTPVDCNYSWSSWSECNCLGKRTRVISIYQQPSCNGTSCPSITTEVGLCNNRMCHEEGGECNKELGFCQCYAGRNGTRCESTCPFGTYGLNCAHQCYCMNGCDPRTGDCKCTPVDCNYSWSSWSECNCLGKRTRVISIYQQPSCNGTSCPSITTEVGLCNNSYCVKEGGDCNENHGFCQCYAGRNGTRCESTCPSGTYGLNCAHRCKNGCRNGCDPRTGECNCIPVACSYSWSSWSSCSCSGKRTRVTSIIQQPSCNGSPCPSIITDTGRCHTGHCLKGGFCHHKSGLCKCRAGTMGSRCESSCPSGMYGYKCAYKCDCLEGMTCDPKDGSCKCSGKGCVNIDMTFEIDQDKIKALGGKK